MPLILGGFYIYTLDYYKAVPDVLALTQEQQNVKVQVIDKMVVFQPTEEDVKAGLIFYPGGKVEHLAYAPLMQNLAQEGYLCVLVKMPFNLAVFDIKAGDKVIEAFPTINIWYIGGHSLGGAMASVYGEKNAEKLEGIIFLAAYPSSDLSNTKLKMLSVYGTEDGVLNRETFDKLKENAPVEAYYHEIPGGNHAYFGSYGEQKGDGVAKITPEEQLAITTGVVLDFWGESNKSMESP